jgi:hypothetical protein
MNNDEENPVTSIEINESQLATTNHSDENDRYCGLDVDSHFLIFVTIYVSIVLTLYVTS